MQLQGHRFDSLTLHLLSNFHALVWPASSKAALSDFVASLVCLAAALWPNVHPVSFQALHEMSSLCLRLVSVLSSHLLHE